MKKIFLSSLLLFGCIQEADKKVPINTHHVNSQATEILQREANKFFAPLPDRFMEDIKQAKMIHLGKKLFFEKKLSRNNSISCNSCHLLNQYGVDNEPTSPGHNGRRGNRNSPTVYNAALNISQFWDGRAKDLAAQAVGPILNPIEHGLGSAKEALGKINTEEYKALFVSAFGNAESFTYSNIGVAIGEFEKTLLTPSRFDDYLKGDIKALSQTEKKGLSKFLDVGCVHCHNGVGIGGNSYQIIGAINPYPTKDLGRFEITKDEDDKKLFKVPTLRNVTKTGPYFHDGKIKSLEEAIRLMGYHQLDEKLGTEDVQAIQSFLQSLEAKELPKF